MNWTGVPTNSGTVSEPLSGTWKISARPSVSFTPVQNNNNHSLSLILCRSLVFCLVRRHYRPAAFLRMCWLSNHQHLFSKRTLWQCEKKKVWCFLPSGYKGRPACMPGLKRLRWFMTGVVVFDLLCSEDVNTGICCLQGFMKQLHLFKCSLTGHCGNTGVWRY